MKTSRRAIVSLAIVFLFTLLSLHSVVVANDLSAGLIAHYPFDGDANDASDYGNHGIVHGATLVPDKCGHPNSAYFFNRADSAWIEVPHHDIQNTPVNAGLTLSLWVRPHDSSPVQALIAKQPSGSCAEYHSPTTSNHGGLFDTNLAGEQTYFVSQFADGCGSEGHRSEMPPLEAQAWHHLVITVDVTDPRRELVRFYRDGQLGFSQIYNMFFDPILSQPSLEPIRIGKRKDSDFASGPAYFWGAMDDIRIYNRPLTAAEVLELHALYQENACHPPLPVPTCDGREATIMGTNGNDLLLGTAGDNVIAGLGGDDVIYGLGGHDVMCGGPGNDVLLGGLGRDRLFGEDGDDVLLGGPGNDRLVGAAGNDMLSGGLGVDYLAGGGGRDTLFGGPGNDRLFGGADRDYLQGGTDDDALSGGSGSDICAGGGQQTADTADASCETALNVP